MEIEQSHSYGSIQVHFQDSLLAAVVDFEIRQLDSQWLLVFQTRRPNTDIQLEHATDVIYQHQRRSTPMSSYSTSTLEDSDPAPYCDYTGLPVEHQVNHPTWWLRIDLCGLVQKFQVPSAVWRWTSSQWQPQPSQGDEAGWQYAADFESSWQESSGMFTFVRRRQLVRERVRELPQNLIAPSAAAPPGITFDKATDFNPSKPVLFSECSESTLHWLELACVAGDDAAGMLSSAQAFNKVLMSDGDVQKQCFELVGVPSATSDAPLHELCYAARKSIWESRMHVIHLVPSLVVVNRMLSSILVRQEDSPVVLQIAPNERTPLWWYQPSQSRDVSIHLDDGLHTEWTQPFSATGAESKLLRCRDNNGTLDIFQACVCESLSNVVIICEEPCPPLRILNQSSYSLAVGESKGSGFQFEASMPDALPPLSQLNYALSAESSHLVIALVGHPLLHAPHTSIKLGNKPGQGSIQIRDADNEVTPNPNPNGEQIYGWWMSSALVLVDE